jgi:hypothetical protein
MAFQRNKIRYHRTRSKLLKQLPSTWGLFLYL